MPEIVTVPSHLRVGQTADGIVQCLIGLKDTRARTQVTLLGASSLKLGTDDFRTIISSTECNGETVYRSAPGRLIPRGGDWRSSMRHRTSWTGSERSCSRWRPRKTISSSPYRRCSISSPASATAPKRRREPSSNPASCRKCALRRLEAMHLAFAADLGAPLHGLPVGSGRYLSRYKRRAGSGRVAPVRMAARPSPASIC
jgi:hypothetical protein